MRIITASHRSKSRQKPHKDRSLRGVVGVRLGNAIITCVSKRAG